MGVNLLKEKIRELERTIFKALKLMVVLFFVCFNCSGKLKSTMLCNWLS